MNYDTRYALRTMSELWENPGSPRKEKKKRPVYVRVEVDGFAYYIRRSVYKTMKLADEERRLSLTQCADYAVNLATNELVKCRHTIDEIIRGFTEGVTE